MSAVGRLCSLMGQGQQLGSRDCATSSGACVLCVLIRALDGVSWVRSGSVEIAFGRMIGRMLQNRRHHPLPPLGVAPTWELVSASWSALIGYAGLNSVPCRSMACMMIASRLASAIRAFRKVDRLAMANAQSFNFSGPL
jgi:hypothetical protein